MKPNPLLAKIRGIKDEFAREAYYDVHRLCSQTREWARTHPYDGPMIREAGDLRRLRGHDETARVREEPGDGGGA